MNEKESKSKCKMKNLIYIITLCLILYLFRVGITEFLFNYIGTPFFSQVSSSSCNDRIVILITLLLVVICLVKLTKRKARFNLIISSLCLVISIIYIGDRLYNYEHYIPFFSFNNLYYMDCFWFVSLISLIILGNSKREGKHTEICTQNAIVDQYLNITKVNYAVMLEGKWGIGKSYYWRYKLTPILKQARYKVVYVSLFGMEDVNSLRHRIEKQLYPLATHPFWETIGRSFFNILGIEWNHSDNIAVVNSLKLDWKNIVLCFDDIERTNKGEFQSMLGYINTFIEQGEAHVFLICNEDKIQEEDQEMYTAYKEKLVRFSTKINIDYTTTFNNIIVVNGVDKLYNQNLLDYLRSIYYYSEHTNFRTVEFNIEILKKMYTELTACKDVDSNSLLRYYIFLSAFYSMVYSKYGFNILLKVTNFTAPPRFNLDLGDSTTESNTVLSEEEKKNNMHVSHIKEKIQKSLPDERWGESKTILEYIKTSTWDSDLFKKEIEVIIVSYLRPQTQETEEHGIMDTLNNPWNTEDNVLQQTVFEAIDKIKNGQIKFSYYPEMYSRIVSLRSFEFIEIPYTNIQLRDIFLEGLDKINVQYMDELDSLLSTIEHDNPSEECKEIINAVKSKNETQGQRLYDIQMREVLSQPQKWSSSSLRPNSRFSQYKNTQAKWFFPIFIGAENVQKREWTSSLQRRRDEGNFTSDEFPFLEEMKTLCEERYKNTSKSVSHRYYKYIIDIINEILAKSKDSAQP